jgi:hypothetical protein
MRATASSRDALMPMLAPNFCANASFSSLKVDHDNRVRPQVVRRLDDAEADAASADHGHRLPGAHVG